MQRSTPMRGVDRALGGHLGRRALAEDASLAGVGAFGVLADDDAFHSDPLDAVVPSVKNHRLSESEALTERGGGDQITTWVALVFVVVLVVPGSLMLAAGPAAATVSAVSGSAFGESVDLTQQVLGTPVNVTSGPMPEVSCLRRVVVLTASALEADAPGVLHTGVLEVSTHGTTGPGGTATSWASVADATIEYANLLTAGLVQSSCTVNEQGVNGQTTILDLAAPTTAGTVANYQPPTNTTFVLPDGITVIFNEQILAREGGNSAITVNAVHVIIDNQLTGTEGDIVLAQSH